MNIFKATEKFQRTYFLQIQGSTAGEFYKIGSELGKLPLLTLEFSVKRDIQASANVGTFRIRNLNKSIRESIYHDWYDLGHWRSFSLKAGYVGSPLSTIFDGLAQNVSSYKEEQGTDFITEIEGQDYALSMSTSFSSWTTEPNTTRQDVIKRLVNDLKLNSQKYGLTLGIGVIGDYSGIRYAHTVNDYTWKLLQTETQRTNYIDNGKIYCLPNDTTFRGDVTLISAETGLLGTPRRFQTYISCEMIFEPGLIPGQQVYLDTSSFPLLNSNFNNTYKVVSVQHSGVISSAVGGKCKTIAILQLPPGSPSLAAFGL